MPVGLIGVGRLGRVLVDKLAGQLELCIFDRNIDCM